ncbi:TonB-dependent receptor [Hymenobacter lutimineralis]|uniref:TonB-dependent receptor n=1 Tax=Hymenobacter lutimineralis TaxID=2606448 RepID=UPI0016562494|nr:TonB-dependent receptor [Hymenobacter lutimineralis]
MPTQLAGALAPATVVLSGYVTDATTGEALIGAVVAVAGQPTLSAGTNSYGFYSLRVPEGRITLQVYYLGYQPLMQEVEASTLRGAVRLQLQPQAQELGEVQVVAGRATELDQVNRLTLRGAELKQLPRLMGEADAVKAVQLLPGVQTGREGSSDLQVRGGSPDQNLILLDGVPVYNVAHLLGLFSVFNPDAVRTVDLVKGGFPAPYGGRLSSVVDVQLKEGNNQRFGGEGAVGLISSKLLLEGPVRSEKTAFLVAARRTYLDVFTGLAGLLSGQDVSRYSFHDVNLKLNHTFSERDRVYVSLYGGRDKFSDRQRYSNGQYEDEQRFRLQWGNFTGAVRWNHLFSRRLFSNLTLLHSGYRFGQSTTSRTVAGGLPSQRQTDYQSRIRDWGAKLEFDYLLSERQAVRFGAAAYQHHFRPESVRLQADTVQLAYNAFPTTTAREFYGYADDRIRFSARWQASVGVHISGFLVNDTFYSSLQPRLAVNYLPASTISLRASFATMAQYLHLLSNTTTGTPTDIWVPATDKLRPQRSWQATLGVAKTMGPHWEATADVYYKELRDVVEFRDGADFISDFLRSGPQTDFGGFVSPPYEQRVARGRGRAYGTEWLLRKRQGRTTGWAGYTLAWAWRQLPGINFGREYPYTYDSRHSVVLVANHQLTPQLSLGGSFQFRTGYVTTLPLTRYQAYVEPGERPYSETPVADNVDHLGERNNYRLPAYHRLDVSLTHTKKKAWGERSWNISVYNAYSHRNPYFLYLSQPFTSSGTRLNRRLYQISLFPILPSLSYGFKF